MSLSLNNSVDIVANSVKIVEEQYLLDVGDGLLNTAVALLTKADKDNVYEKADVYNKPEINRLLNNLSDATVAEQLALKADIND